MANIPQNAGINSAPAHDSIFRHFISSLNPNDPFVTWINAGALDFLSRLERDGRLFELRDFTSPTATDLNDIQRSLFKDCVKKTLTMSGRFEHEKRACEALRQLARTLPSLLLTHSKMEIRAACNKFLKLKREWESLWNKCMAKGHARQDKLAANPLSTSSGRLPKKTPWLKNRPGLATFPKQIRLYARSLNQHLGMTHVIQGRCSWACESS